MGFFENLKDSFVLKKDKSLSFIEWVSFNRSFIEASLIQEGLSFLHAKAEKIHSLTHLTLDNRWHYLDKAKKERYKANILISSDGVPSLYLVYHTFRHGGLSEKFDSKAVLKALWLQAKGTPSVAPVAKPILQKMDHPKPLPKPTLDWMAHDVRHWEHLRLSGVSHYLNRKGLAFFNLPGIRYAKDHIAVQLIDTEGHFFGLQRIYNDGQKRFTKGCSKKGHFAIIGLPALPDKCDTIHICEGVATAASIFCAINEPVFSALDAFNLLPVARSLKKLYPKASIMIWADNDWQKADKRTKFGKPIGNTGLIHANRAAFKLRKALVCTPDFSHLDKELAASATDFNDVHMLSGLEAIAQTLPRKPDIKLALSKELTSFHQYAHGVLSPNQFESGKKVLYKSRYLPKDIFEGEGVHLVRSPIGSGKTEIVEYWLKKKPEASVLFTTHLISLVENAASRLKLTSYNDCDGYDLQIESRLAICLNSLGKLTLEGNLRSYDIVIIDEIEQVLARLTTQIDQKPLVFSVLEHLMRHAKTLICLDAHLSETTTLMIKRFCCNKNVTIHFNEYEASNKKSILLHESPESLQMEALKVLESGKSAYLTFNSKREAFKTLTAFKLAFPLKKGLYISGDNTGDKENLAFFSDVNKVSKMYDYIICTPSVSTGVSIDNGHFDFVGGIFNAQINTANDCMQALGRIRNHEKLHVFCERRLGNKSLDPKVISAKWLSTYGHDLELMSLNEEGGRILLNNDYEALLLSVTLSRHRSFNDFYQAFALLGLQEGINLDYFDNTLDNGTQKHLRAFKKACVDNEVESMGFEPLGLSPKELLALANKPRKTLIETRKSKNLELIAFYNLDASDEDSVKALASMDNDGRFQRQILELELALGDDELAKSRFLKQLDEGVLFRADLKHFATLQLLYKRLLDTLHLSSNEEGRQGLLSTFEFHYSADFMLKSGFIDWVDEQRVRLQGIINIPIKAKLYADPLRFVSMLLSRLGLKQKRVGRTSHATYHLCTSRINLLNDILKRRKAGFAGVSMPLDTASCVVKQPKEASFLFECFEKIRAFFTVEKNLDPVFT